MRTTTSLAASLVLAATVAITPAHGTSPAVATATAADDAPSSSLAVDDLVPRGSSERAPELEPQAPGGEVLLDTTATVQKGASTARKPKVVKRSARLWLTSTVDFWPPDEQDVSVVQVDQDLNAKRITVAASYRATPTSSLNSVVSVYLGKWNSNQSTCNAAAILLAFGHGAASDALIIDLDKNPIGTASRSLSGTTLTVTATGKGAANAGYDCVYAFLDSLDSAGASSQLMSSGADDFEAEMEKAPKFDFYSSDLNAAYPGKWNKVRIHVSNDGNLTAKNIKLRLSGKKLKFKKKTIKVGTLKPDKSKVVYARVKLSGKKTRTLRAKATASGKWTATTKTKVGYRPNPTKLRNLNGRSYWGFFTGTGGDNIWQVRGLHFVNKSWVYAGVPTEGGVPKCSSKVKECFRYSYNRSKGEVRFGKFRGKVDSEGIKITKAPKKSDLKSLKFYPLAKPKKNAKIKATVKYTDGNGNCLAGSCSSWWRTLKLKKNKKFTWTRGSISTFGFPPFQTIHSSSGPTLKGTYKVLSKGRIRFTYTDPETGKRKRDTYTIGIDANALGKHHPKHGLLIGAMPHT